MQMKLFEISLILRFREEKSDTYKAQNKFYIFVFRSNLDFMVPASFQKTILISATFYECKQHEKQV